MWKKRRMRTNRWRVCHEKKITGPNMKKQKERFCVRVQKEERRQTSQSS